MTPFTEMNLYLLRNSKIDSLFIKKLKQNDQHFIINIIFILVYFNHLSENFKIRFT